MERKAHTLYALAVIVLMAGLYAALSVVLWYQFSDKLYMTQSSNAAGFMADGVVAAEEAISGIDPALPGAEAYSLIMAVSGGDGTVNSANSGVTSCFGLVRAVRALEDSGEYKNGVILAETGDYLCLKYTDGNNASGFAVFDLDTFFESEDQRLAFITAMMYDTRPWLMTELRVTGLLSDDGYITPSHIEYDGDGGTRILLDREPQPGEVTIKAGPEDISLCLRCNGSYRKDSADDYTSSIEARLPEVDLMEEELQWYVEHSFGDEFYPVYTRYRQSYGFERFAGFTVVDSDLDTGEALILVRVSGYDNSRAVLERYWGYFAMFAAFFIFAGFMLIWLNHKNFRFGETAPLPDSRSAPANPPDAE